jgi:hypothetical protein
MHFNFDFSTRQVLWTLTFAAQLVLLVVLLGRNRARRYPWFTASVGLFALQLLAEELLAGRMARIPFQEILLVLSDLGAIVGILVLVEVARRAFAGAKRSMWIVNTVGMLVVAGGVLVAIGPWPAAKDLVWGTLLGKLRLMQLVVLKGDMLVALLTVELGLLVVLFGRHFKAGWRSHTQQIAIGLSTVAISLLTIQAAVQSIVTTAHPSTHEEYERILGLIGRLMNANSMIYVAVLLWWIFWLWLDEPETPKAPATETAGEPEAPGE